MVIPLVALHRIQDEPQDAKRCLETSGVDPSTIAKEIEALVRLQPNSNASIEANDEKPPDAPQPSEH